MTEQLTTNAEALRLFFTEDVYLVPGSIPIVAEPPAPVRTVDFKYLGKNQKNVLILVNDGNNDVSSESGRELLRNLVKAIQLTANDFALLNYFHFPDSTFEELTQFFNCRTILSFGVSSDMLGLPAQTLHELMKIEDVELVFSDRLDLLAADQAGKKKLWGSLKQLTINS